MPTGRPREPAGPGKRVRQDIVQTVLSLPILRRKLKISADATRCTAPQHQTRAANIHAYSATVDVAGALGMSHCAGLGQELYLLRWMPDYMTDLRVQTAIRDATDLLELREAASSTHAPGPPMPAKIQRVRIARAVVAEYLAHDTCQHCQGHATAYTRASGWIKCPGCGGSGRASDRGSNRRARMIGIRAQTYLQHIRPWYDWLFDVLCRLANEAQRAHARAMSDDE